VFRLSEKDKEASNAEKNKDTSSNSNSSGESKITPEEIFDIIRTIQDPEHPNSLEQLGVVSLEQVELSLASDRNENTNRNQDEVSIRFTPTIPHCSMATLIGLCLRVKLHRSLPPTNYKVDVSIEPGTHVSEKAINKQLRDKERVRAALENKHLAGVVDKCIRNGMMTTKD
jgi:metal-sulfur cluster biosynthetic enzyme